MFPQKGTPTETLTPVAEISTAGGHICHVPLQPCGDKISFMYSAKQNNRRKNRGRKRETTVACAGHIQQHQGVHKNQSRTLQMSPLVCGLEGASGKPPRNMCLPEAA